ncbi:hypothetical protein [Paracoccus sp. KR1-242]|uniref:hypothetical protein n=1 Tax=Paracoccus sp. KR1-242 TaxID=3410028 RepID=UPI003C094BA4
MDINTLLPPETVDPQDHPKLKALVRLWDGLEAIAPNWDTEIGPEGWERDRTPLWHANLSHITMLCITGFIDTGPGGDIVKFRHHAPKLLRTCEPPQGDWDGFRDSVINIHGLWQAALDTLEP